MLAHLTDTFHKMRRAAVPQIVAIHARDHHVLQLQCADSARKVQRFVGIEWIGAAVAHVAERAATRAFVAHDHERGRAFTETFAYVRATRLFTHRMQVVFAQNLLDLGKARVAGRGFHANPVRLLQLFNRDDLDRDARRLGLRLLFGGGVVGHGGRRTRCSSISSYVSHSVGPVGPFRRPRHQSVERRPQPRRRCEQSDGSPATPPRRASQPRHQALPGLPFPAPRSRTG